MAYGVSRICYAYLMAYGVSRISNAYLMAYGVSQSVFNLTKTSLPKKLGFHYKFAE